MNIVTSYSSRCAAQNEKTCKIQFQEELTNMFRQMLINPIIIRFNDSRNKNIDIKICALSDMTGELENLLETNLKITASK